MTVQERAKALKDAGVKGVPLFDNLQREGYIPRNIIPLDKGRWIRHRMDGTRGWPPEEEPECGAYAIKGDRHDSPSLTRAMLDAMNGELGRVAGDVRGTPFSRWKREVVDGTARIESYEPPYAPIPTSTAPVANNFSQLKDDGSGFALFSDTHVPYHDAGILNAMVRESKRLGVKRFVLIGDFMDANQFSKRGRILGHQRRWQDDVEEGKSVLAGLLNYFDSGVVLMGNHDRWYEQHYRGMADPEWLMAAFFGFEGRVEFSRFEQARVESSGKRFRLLHGANFSGANPLGVAQKHSARTGEGIVMGHQHLAVDGWDASGQHQCVCLGMTADLERMAYPHASPKAHPVMTQSFAILKGGVIRHYKSSDLAFPQ